MLYKKNILIFLMSILTLGCASSTEVNLTSKETPKNRPIKLNIPMEKEKRVALVIGNNNYNGVMVKLRNPINDAKAIKKVLERGGFTVIYKEDITKKEGARVLKDFYTKIRGGGVGMFYFSGHGIEVDGENYLIPVDAKLSEKSDVEFEALSLNKITKKMQNLGNRLNIVVLDACRNDPFSRSVGSGGLAKVEPIGLFVSYATGAGSVASDGKEGENGLFTKSLIKYMQQPLDLQNVFQYAREEVYRNSNQKQFPAVYNQTVNGKFYFTLPNEEESTPIRAITKNIQLKISISKIKFIVDKKIENSITLSNISNKIVNDMLQTIVEIENHTEEKLSLQYRYKWFDRENIEVAEGMSTWQTIFVDAKGSKSIKETTPMPKAVRCKVYFK